MWRGATRQFPRRSMRSKPPSPPHSAGGSASTGHRSSGCSQRRPLVRPRWCASDKTNVPATASLRAIKTDSLCVICTFILKIWWWRSSPRFCFRPKAASPTDCCSRRCERLHPWTAHRRPPDEIYRHTPSLVFAPGLEGEASAEPHRRSRISARQEPRPPAASRVSGAMTPRMFRANP